MTAAKILSALPCRRRDLPAKTGLSWNTVRSLVAKMARDRLVMYNVTSGMVERYSVADVSDWGLTSANKKGKL